MQVNKDTDNQGFWSRTYALRDKINEVTIRTLLHLKCIRLVSVRSSLVNRRLYCMNGVRIELTKIQMSFKWSCTSWWCCVKTELLAIYRHILERAFSTRSFIWSHRNAFLGSYVQRHVLTYQINFVYANPCILEGGYSIAPKTTSANAASASP